MYTETMEPSIKGMQAAEAGPSFELEARRRSRTISASLAAVAALSITSCLKQESSAPSYPEVTVERGASVTTEPLGDVVIGELEVGQTVSVECIRTNARTNAGVRGGAAYLYDVEGWVATSTPPHNEQHHENIFSVSHEELVRTIPSCDMPQ